MSAALMDAAIEMQRAIMDWSRRERNAKSDKVKADCAARLPAMRERVREMERAIGERFASLDEAIREALEEEDYALVSARNDGAHAHYRAQHDGARSIFLVCDDFDRNPDWQLCYDSAARREGKTILEDNAQERGRVYVAIRIRAANKRERETN